MLYLHVLIALFAVGRLTEIITIDRITDGLRKRWPSYFLSCPRCVSVWAGLACTASLVYVPWLNWPLALSAMWLIFAQLFSKLMSTAGAPGNRAIAIDVTQNGDVNISKSDFDFSQTRDILSKVAEKMRAENG